MKLSICIPTYNRAEYLPATFESIAAQWRDDLEITVADNASTDNTAELVAQLGKRFGNVRYFRWDENQGADRNYLKCVEIATGEYCWILGSDDPIADGAVRQLMAHIDQQQPTIVLFNRLLCTKELTPIREDRFLDAKGADYLRYEFAQTGSLEKYLNDARSLAAAFSYLSSTAFRKQAWDAVPTNDTFIGTAYVHSQKLLGACADGAVLTYFNHALVHCRLGNDHFREHGLARRVLLDLQGYTMLADACFGDRRPACARGLVQLLRHEYPWARVMRYQGVLGADPQWAAIVELLRTRIGYIPLALPMARLLGRSRLLVRLSFWMRDQLQRLNGLAQGT